MKLRRDAGILAVASLVTLTRAAQADTVPPIVRVYVAGPPEAVTASRDAVQDLCARSNVAVVVRDAAGADEALLATSHERGLAEAYIDLRAGTPTRVIVVDGETRQYLERRTLPPGTSLEISIETVAHVVCAAVESSLAARVVAPTPPVSAAPLVERAAAPSAPAEPTALSARLGAFGAAEDFGAGFRAGLGAVLSVGPRSGLVRLAALVSLEGYPAADVERAGASASFASVGVRLLPVLEWQATRRVTALVGLGGGGDWVHVRAEQTLPGVDPASPGATIDAIACGLVGVRIALGSHVGALLALDADIDLFRRRYVSETAQGSQVFFEPARVRPLVLAGLFWSFGAEHMPSSVRGVSAEPSQ